MFIYKEKLKIELEENTNYLKEQIKQLRNLKKVVYFNEIIKR